MALYGYARVATAEHDGTLQEHALRAAGCEVIRQEKMSGTSTVGRKELAAITVETLIAEAEEAKWPRLTRGIGDFHVTVYSYAQFSRKTSSCSAFTPQRQ